MNENNPVTIFTMLSDMSFSQPHRLIGELQTIEVCFRIKCKQFICDVLCDEVKAQVTKKITEKRLKWYGHGKAMNEGHVLRRMLDAPGP